MNLIITFVQFLLVESQRNNKPDNQTNQTRNDDVPHDDERNPKYLNRQLPEPRSDPPALNAVSDSDVFRPNVHHIVNSAQTGIRKNPRKNAP